MYVQVLYFLHVENDIILRTDIVIIDNPKRSLMYITRSRIYKQQLLKRYTLRFVLGLLTLVILFD